VPDPEFVPEPEPEPEFVPEPPLALPPPVEEPPDVDPVEPLEPLDPLVCPAPPVFAPDVPAGATVDESEFAAPSSCTPSLSLQAVSESAASATVAAAKRRVRGRAVNADMVVPFGKAGRSGPPNRSVGGVL
jgi:hypothetical protein